MTTLEERDEGTVEAGLLVAPFDVRRGERRATIRLAFDEFLGATLLVVAAVLAAGGITFALDRLHPAVLDGVRSWLEGLFFQDGETTSGILQTLSQTVITVTAIVFSLLLVAVQQTASGLSSQVIDQYVRRRANQVFFGFFVGVGLLALLVSMTAHKQFNPVLTGTLTLVLASLAILALVALVYTTLNQMRPTLVVEAVHDATVAARRRQLERIVLRTLREPQRCDLPAHALRTEHTGFVMRVDIDRLQRAIDRADGAVEVELQVTIGEAVAYHDRIAIIRAQPGVELDPLAREVEGSVHREHQRNVDDIDAAYGLEQLHNIGWTAVSTAKHTPLPGRLVIENLRDMLARFTSDDELNPCGPTTAIVYRDRVPETLMGIFESLIIVAGESKQHHIYAGVMDALARALPTLPDWYADAAREAIVRGLPLLEHHVPSLQLQNALETAAGALEAVGAEAEADQVRRCLQSVE